VRTLRLLAGGASQEAWAVGLAFDAGDELTLVMRRDMGGVLNFATLSRAAEFAVIATAYAGGVPVPKPYFEPCEIAGKPAFFMEFVTGEAVGRRLVTDPAFAEARALLPEQLAEALAAIHRIDYRAAGLGELLGGPAPGRSALSVEFERLYAELDSLDEAHPALELALRWLSRNEPPRESETTLVHGDFRIGNVLVDPQRGLRAVLDWEFCHYGDPHEDVAWVCLRAWRFGNVALEAGGIAPRETWLQAYERASGRAIDRTRIAYLEVLGNVKWAIGAAMQARRHLSGLEPSIELASLGRLAAEMEFEALRTLAAYRAMERVG
jgi:aminoglycoside phosphotransferase (APT) family kinase protein